jgi:hypothetical protein
VAHGAGSLDRLLRRSGLDAQLATVPDEVRAVLLERTARPTDPARVHELLAVAARAFAPARLRESVRRDLARLDRPTRAAALAFLSSASGARVTRAEIAAATGQQAAREERQGAELARALPPGRRLLLEQLERAADEAERRLELDRRLSAALVEGVRRARPELAMRTGADGPASRPASAELVEAYRRAAVADAAWTYRNVSDEDLQRYAGFLASPRGRDYQKAVAAAVLSAFEAAARRFGELLAGERSA